MTKNDKNKPQTDAANEIWPQSKTFDLDQIISQKLKTLYSAVEDEEIPSRFIDLLEKLDEAERRAQAQNPKTD